MQQFCPLVCPLHCLSSGLGQGLHDPAQYRSENYEDGEPCQRARPQGGYEQTEADRHLNGRGPAHVEAATAEVYPRDIGRDVID